MQRGCWVVKYCISREEEVASFKKLRPIKAASAHQFPSARQERLLARLARLLIPYLQPLGRNNSPPLVASVSECTRRAPATHKPRSRNPGHTHTVCFFLHRGRVWHPSATAPAFVGMCFASFSQESERWCAAFCLRRGGAGMCSIFFITACSS